MSYEELEVGAEIPLQGLRVSIVQTVMYCGITWDFARYHYDPEFVRTFGYPGPVVDPQMHGAFLARMLTDWVADSGRVGRLNLRYRGPCYLGDTITYTGKVAEKYAKDGKRYADCNLLGANQKGEKLVEATASILFY